MTEVRVLIADDHVVFRQGMAALLAEVGGITVVGDAGSADEAVEAVQRLVPDVVLMDLGMPGDGVRATAAIATHELPVAVLVLTMHSDDVHVVRALRAGARGYLLKDAAAAEIVRAIQAVAAGQAIFDPGVGPAVLGSRAGAAYPFPDLSPREREVLDRLAGGLSTEAIAGRLGISTKTVQNNISQILLKLSARDRTQAVALARDAGIH